MTSLLIQHAAHIVTMDDADTRWSDQGAVVNILRSAALQRQHQGRIGSSARECKEEVEQVFGGGWAWRDRNGQRERCDNKQRAAPTARTAKLCTQRLPHPTQQTGRGN